MNSWAACDMALGMDVQLWPIAVTAMPTAKLPKNQGLAE
jgi:hypothetical protein